MGIVAKASEVCSEARSESVDVRAKLAMVIFSGYVVSYLGSAFGRLWQVGRTEQWNVEHVLPLLNGALLDADGLVGTCWVQKRARKPTQARARCSCRVGGSRPPEASSS